MFTLIPPLKPGLPGDEGLIGKDSLVWKIAGHKAVTLGGPAALLLQLSHPLVAAGVAQHSTFQTDPLKRLIGTLEATLVTTFGDCNQAAMMAAHVDKIHRPVTGTLDARAGVWPSDQRYSAHNPELSLWVYATLVEMALDAYSTYVRPLSFMERSRYYEESEPFGRLFGVTARVRPLDYIAFEIYFNRMADSLEVSQSSREIAKAIFGSRFHGLPVSPGLPFLAAALLPERLRRAYGLRWGFVSQVAWVVFRRFAPLAEKVLPWRIKYWQHYHMARRRVSS